MLHKNGNEAIFALVFCLCVIESSSLIFPNSSGPTIKDYVTCAKQFQDGSQKPNPNIGLKTDQVIANSGYPVETINVTTADGYILTVFRIPFSPKSPQVEGQIKKPIYLNHGLQSIGQQWILQHGDRNLGYKLSDAGFDVFLSNCRGSSYSQGHVNLTVNDREYWDFSWDEMARYDVPAVMKMIRNVTGSEKMYYAGHSMGTTQYFIAMSEMPELNNLIYTAFLLAPIAFISRSTSVLRLLAPLAYNGQYLANPVLGGKQDFYQQLKKYTGLNIGQLCAPSALACMACSNALFLINGYDGPQTNYTQLSYYMSLFPDTASTKSSVHYAQSMAKGTFRQFDYGSPAANQARYGQDVTVPKDYDLSKITAPTVFYYALNDNLGVPVDVLYTAAKLNPITLKENNLIEWPLFTHSDFATAIDADILLYNKIKTIMQNGLYE